MSILLKLGFLWLIVICPLFILKTTVDWSVSTVTIESKDQALLEQEIFNLNLFLLHHPIVTHFEILSETSTFKEIKGYEEYVILGIIPRKAIRHCTLEKMEGGFIFESAHLKLFDAFEIYWRSEILIENKGNELILRENAHIKGLIFPTYLLKFFATPMHVEMFENMKEWMEKHEKKI